MDETKMCGPSAGVNAPDCCAGTSCQQKNGGDWYCYASSAADKPVGHTYCNAPQTVPPEGVIPTCAMDCEADAACILKDGDQVTSADGTKTMTSATQGPAQCIKAGEGQSQGCYFDFSGIP
jgi:hypothetical protein